jgi:hypothetical protein
MLSSQIGGLYMSGQVILYFEDQSDALGFALAAGSAMAGDGTARTTELLQKTSRANRIRLDAANKNPNKGSTSGKIKQISPPPECVV